MTRGNWTDKSCWYVSVMDAGRHALVLGPFATEDECRAWAYSDSAKGGDSPKHTRLVKAAEKQDPRAWFYAWGMTKMADGHREGVLNRVMGF